MLALSLIGLLHIIFGMASPTGDIHALIHVDMRSSNITIPVTLSSDLINTWKSSLPSGSPLQNLVVRSDNDDTTSTTTENFIISRSRYSRLYKSEVMTTRSPLDKECPLTCESCMVRNANKEDVELIPSKTPSRTDFNSLKALHKREVPDCLTFIIRFFHQPEISMSLECGDKNITLTKLEVYRQKRSIYKPNDALVERNEIMNTCSGDIPSPSVRKNCYNVAAVSFDEKNSKFCSTSIGCDVGSYFKEGECVLEAENTVAEPICSPQAFKLDLSEIIPNPTVPRFIPSNVCKVGKMIIREDCEEVRSSDQEISLVNFNGKEVLVMMKHHFIFQEQIDNINNYICSGCTKPGCKRCHGDESYVMGFGKHDISQCNCSLIKDAKFGAIHLVMSGQQFRVKYYFRFTREVQYKRQKSEAQPICEECKVTCSNSVLKIEELTDDVKAVKICSSTICETVAAEKTINIPLVFQFLSMSLEIRFLSASGKHSDLFLAQCERKSGCELISCSFCLERLVNFNCYTTKEYLYGVVGLFLMSLLLGLILKSLNIIISIINLFCYIFKAIIFIGLFLFKISHKLCGVSLKKGKRVYRKLETFTENETAEFVSEETAVQIEINPPFRQNTYKKTILLIILIISLHTTMGCTKVNTLTIRDQDCVLSEGNIQCEVSTKVILNLGTLDTDSCLSVMNNGRVTGTVHFKVSSVKTKCIEEHLYWTYDPILHSQQSCRCWSIGVCSADRCIENTLTNTTAFEEGITRHTGPGVEGCQETNSQFLSKCGTPVNGCCYYSVTLKPKERKAYRVSRCSGWYWEVDVSVKSMFINANEIGTIKLVPGIETSQAFGTMMLTSVSQPSADDLQNCFVTDDETNVSYFVNCNKKGEQIIGRIGEIKCASKEMVLTKPHDCTFPTKSIVIIPQNSGLSPQVRFTNVESLLKNNKLPVINSVYSITQSEGAFIVKRSVSESFQIVLGLSKFDVKPVYQLPECKIKFVSLDGCFQCLHGAVIKLITKCAKYPALGSIKCQTMETPTPFVAEKDGPLSIKTLFKVQSIDELCLVSMGRSEHNMTVKGELIRVVFNETSYDSSNILILKKTMGTDFGLMARELGKSFLDLFSSWSILKIVCIVLVLGILLLFLITKLLSGSTASKFYKLV